MMNDEFNQRWSAAVSSARRVREEAGELPFGLTTRVLARFEEAPVEPWGELMSSLGLRAVMTSALLFAVSAVVLIWQMEGVPLVPDWIEVPLVTEVFLP
jgi:hypothetical protein